MTSGIIELAIVTSFAAILGILARILKQPIFLAYLVTGILIGYLGLRNLVDPAFFKLFSDIGIMLLLFMIGLEVNYSSVRKVGSHAVVLGLGQIIFTFIFGFALAHLFGYNNITGLYIALALTFSSTVVVVKLLSEKKDLYSLYGRLSLGFLLVQDLVAVFVLLILGGLITGNVSALSVIETVGKGCLLFVAIYVLGRRILPSLFDRVVRSQELMFLISIAWLFLMAAIVEKLGFSIEIAGFLAGLALANSSENYEIASRMRPLRDFFLLMFFISLGSSVVISGLSGLVWPIVVFSLFVLIGNPLIVMVIMGLMGYRRRTSFLTGVTMAQISEFSLILAALGARLHHITPDIVVIITSVGVISFVVSSYAIMNGDRLAHKMHGLLGIFEKLKPSAEDGLDMEDGFHKPIVIIGGHRIGRGIASHLPKNDILVVDFDPLIIEELRTGGYTALLGDVSDADILEKANLDEADLIVCSSPDFNDNARILRASKRWKKKAKIIVRAETDKDARILYQKGADYVLIPQLTSGNTLGAQLSHDVTGGFLSAMRIHDLKMIEKIS